MITIALGESERQTIVLALVALRLERPGWDDWCRQLVKRLEAETMYDELLRLRRCERGEQDCGLHPGWTHAEGKAHDDRGGVQERPAPTA